MQLYKYNKRPIILPRLINVWGRNCFAHELHIVPSKMVSKDVYEIKQVRQNWTRVLQLLDKHKIFRFRWITFQQINQLHESFLVLHVAQLYLKCFTQLSLSFNVLILTLFVESYYVYVGRCCWIWPSLSINKK